MPSTHVLQGISDPGSALVAAAAADGINVIPVPGPSAVLAGLVGSGLPTDEFMFVGFLPPKKAARQQRIRELAGEGSSALDLLCFFLCFLCFLFSSASSPSSSAFLMMMLKGYTECAFLDNRSHLLKLLHALLLQ